MFCSNCGSEVEDGILFCTECGEPLEETVLTEKRKSVNVKKDLYKKIDSLLKSKQGKTVRYVLIGLTISSMAITIGKGVQFYKDYGWLYQYDLTPETVLEMQTRVQTEEDTIEKIQAELTKAQDRYNYLSSHDISKEWENTMKRQIVQLSVENQMIVQQMKTIVMNEMGYEYHPSYSARQYEDMGINMRDDMLDSALSSWEGGDIVSSGIKSILDAAAEESSFESILEGAKSGLAEGVASYLGDKAKGDVLGTVTGIADSISNVQRKIASMGDVPPIAIAQIGELQKSYLQEMNSFVSKEQITLEDMTVAYDALWGYQNTNQTLKAMAKEDRQNTSAGSQEMEQLISSYYSNYEMMKKYVEIVEGGIQ